MKLLNKFLKTLLIYQIIILFFSIANIFINNAVMRGFVFGTSLSNMIVLLMCDRLDNHDR